MAIAAAETMPEASLILATKIAASSCFSNEATDAEMAPAVSPALAAPGCGGDSRGGDGHGQRHSYRYFRPTA